MDSPGTSRVWGWPVRGQLHQPRHRTRMGLDYALPSLAPLSPRAVQLRGSGAASVEGLTGYHLAPDRLVASE